MNTILSRQLSNLAANPITRAESAHLRRAGGATRRWRRWLVKAAVLFMLAVAMIMFWGEFIGSLLDRDAGRIQQALRPMLDVVMIMVVSVHFIVMLRTLTLSANSITREKQGGSWELLMLTAIDPKHIVRGKWWATVQRQWRTYALLGLLRAGAIVGFASMTSRSLAYIYYSYYRPTWIALPLPGEILLAGGMIFVLTMANLLFTAACGVEASAESKGTISALVRSIFIRLFVPLVAIFLWICPLISYRGAGQAGLNIISRAAITLLDNGVTLGGELASIQYSYGNVYETVSYSRGGEAIISFTLSLVFYAGLTAFALMLAQRSVKRQQGLSIVIVRKVV